MFGEFGMGPEGHNGFSQVEWYRAYLESCVRAGAAGAMFWILTPDPARGYGVTYASDRDRGVLAEITRASQMFASLAAADPPEELAEPTRHLVPRQFAWMRSANDPATVPLITLREDKTILYRSSRRWWPANALRKLAAARDTFGDMEWDNSSLSSRLARIAAR